MFRASFKSPGVTLLALLLASGEVTAQALDESGAPPEAPGDTPTLPKNGGTPTESPSAPSSPVAAITGTTSHRYVTDERTIELPPRVDVLSLLLAGALSSSFTPR